MVWKPGKQWGQTGIREQNAQALKNEVNQLYIVFDKITQSTNDMDIQMTQRKKWILLRVGGRKLACSMTFRFTVIEEIYPYKMLEDEKDTR